MMDGPYVKVVIPSYHPADPSGVMSTQLVFALQLRVLRIMFKWSVGGIIRHDTEHKRESSEDYSNYNALRFLPVLRGIEQLTSNTVRWNSSSPAYACINKRQKASINGAKHTLPQASMWAGLGPDCTHRDRRVNSSYDEIRTSPTRSRLSVVAAERFQVSLQFITRILASNAS